MAGPTDDERKAKIARAQLQVQKIKAQKKALADKTAESVSAAVEQIPVGAAESLPSDPAAQSAQSTELTRQLELRVGELNELNLISGDKLKESESKVLTLTEELQTLSNKESESQSKLNLLATEIHNLKASNEKLISDQAQLRTSLSQAQASLASLPSVDDHERALQGTQKRADHAEAQLDELRLLLKANTAELADLRDSEKKLQLKVVDMKQIEEEKQLLFQTMEKSEGIISDYKEKIRQSEVSQETARENIQQLESRVSELQVKLQDCISSEEISASTIEDLRSRSAAAEQLAAQLQGENADILHALQTARTCEQTLKDTLETERHKLSDIETTVSLKTQEILELEQKIQTFGNLSNQEGNKTAPDVFELQIQLSEANSKIRELQSHKQTESLVDGTQLPMLDSLEDRGEFMSSPFDISQSTQHQQDQSLKLLASRMQNEEKLSLMKSSQPLSPVDIDATSIKRITIRDDLDEHNFWRLCGARAGEEVLIVH